MLNQFTEKKLTGRRETGPNSTAQKKDHENKS